MIKGVRESVEMCDCNVIMEYLRSTNPNVTYPCIRERCVHYENLNINHTSPPLCVYIELKTIPQIVDALEDACNTCRDQLVICVDNWLTDDQVGYVSFQKWKRESKPCNVDMVELNLCDAKHWNKKAFVMKRDVEFYSCWSD